MKDYLLKQYTHIAPESIILGHHGTIHTKIIIQSGSILLILWILYMIVYYFGNTYLDTAKRILGTMALITYLHCILQFLNTYLDSLIVTPSGLQIFERDGFLHYSVQQTSRESIESISYTKNSLTDKFFNIGTINIILEHGENITFSHIYKPDMIAQKLLNTKLTHGPTPGNHLNTESDTSHEKFNILVETLGEVIKDYMDKKQLPDKSHHSGREF